MTVPTYVTYEDRASAMPGVELLAYSLRRFNPQARLVVWSPISRKIGTRLTADEVDWRQTDDLNGVGWNVKPTILIRTLEEASRAMWIDSDVIVVGSLARLSAFHDDQFVVSQEFRDSGETGSKIRVDAWKWRLERTLPFHLNSGAIIATNAHRPLLVAWERLLQSQEYRAAQQIRLLSARPTHMLGDQDVLWAILCSDFASVDVAFLRNGMDIVQDSGANGYHVFDRVRNLRHDPTMLVHALGRMKPWQFGDRESRTAAGINYIRWATYELSPYFIAARDYAGLVGEPAWLRRRNLLARLIGLAAGRNIAAHGLPFALLALCASSTLGFIRRKLVNSSR